MVESSRPAVQGAYDLPAGPEADLPSIAGRGANARRRRQVSKTRPALHCPTTTFDSLLVARLCSMPNYVRWRQKSGSYFFTLVTYDRRPFLTTELARKCLREAIETIRTKLPFEMPASVLLPDHFHCIWMLPDRDSDFSTRWRQIKERFTRAYLAGGGCEKKTSASQAADSRRGIWQPRFWEHLIRSKEEYFAYCDYVHFNPVKHGLVERPEQWPYSTVHRHLKMGWLDPSWTGNTTLKLHVGE
jgi:REP-associated tyrosine transposase